MRYGDEPEARAIELGDGEVATVPAGRRLVGRVLAAKGVPPPRPKTRRGPWFLRLRGAPRRTEMR